MNALARPRLAFDRFMRFCMAPKPAIIPPYQPQRAPLESFIRKAIFFTALVLASMIYGFFYALLPPAFLLFLAAPLCVLALFVIWALPDRDTAPPIRALERLFFLFWFVSITWPNYLAISLPGLPWISLQRLTLAPMALVLLVCASTSAQFRREVADACSASPIITRMVIAYAIVQTVSIAFSSTPVSSFQRYIDLQFLGIMIFLVSAYVFLKPGRPTKWVKLMIVMAIITSVIGIAEYFRQRVLWADHIPSFLKVNDPSVQYTLEGAMRGGKYRANSTFSVSLPFAEFLALTAPFVIHLFMITKDNRVRALCIAVDLLLLGAILATGARLGMIGFLFAHAIYGLIWSVRLWRRNATSLLGPALTLAYPALLAVFCLLVVTTGRVRAVVIGDGSQNASNDGRAAQFDAFWPKLFNRPFGYGPGRAGETLGFTSPGGQLTVDSYIISLGLDYGLLGLGLFFGLILVGVAKAAQIGMRHAKGEASLAHPLSLALGVFLLVKLVLSQEDNNAIFFMMLGLIVALRYRTLSGEPEKAA